MAYRNERNRSERGREKGQGTKDTGSFSGFRSTERKQHSFNEKYSVASQGRNVRPRSDHKAGSVSFDAAQGRGKKQKNGSRSDMPVFADRKPSRPEKGNTERRPGNREAFTARPSAESRWEMDPSLHPLNEIPNSRNELNMQEEQYILAGRNPIREALKNNRDLEKLLVQKGELTGSAREIVQKAKEKKIMVQVVDISRLDEISPRHQGLIAYASAYQYSTVADILQTAEDKGEAPFVIILDGITDPHNLGAIIRTAECTGVHGVIIPQHRSVGLTPSAVKASAGAVEYVKVARVTNINRAIEELQQSNVWVYALSMNGQDYQDTRFEGGVALVIGAEGEGVSRLTEESCDLTVSLPMRGKISSLNASVAAGVMMYHILEARRIQGSRKV